MFCVEIVTIEKTRLYRFNIKYKYCHFCSEHFVFCSQSANDVYNPLMSSLHEASIPGRHEYLICVLLGLIVHE